jgi:formate dehydrogenase major subunit
MKVQAASPRARKSQQMVVEMLLSDMPDMGYRWNDEQKNTPELIAGSAYPSSARGQFDSKNPESTGQHGELSEWADRLGVSVRPR